MRRCLIPESLHHLGNATLLKGGPLSVLNTLMYPVSTKNSTADLLKVTAVRGLSLP